MAEKDWTRASLGERVAHLCGLFEVTQNALGAKAELESGPMSRLANDKRTAPKRAPETLRRLADAWDVSFEWLAFGRGPGLARAVLPDDVRRVVLVAGDAA